MHRYTIEISGESYVVDIDEGGIETYRVVVDGVGYVVRLANDVDLNANESSLQIVTKGDTALEPKEKRIDPKNITEIRAPMPGVVMSIAVQPGDRVSITQQVIVLEAMKMNIPVSSPRDGVVAEVVVGVTQSVGHDDVLLRFEEG